MCGAGNKRRRGGGGGGGRADSCRLLCRGARGEPAGAAASEPGPQPNLHNQGLFINAPFFIAIEDICSGRAGNPGTEGTAPSASQSRCAPLAAPPHLLRSPAPSSPCAPALQAGRCPTPCQMQLTLLWPWRGRHGGVRSQHRGRVTASSLLGPACAAASWAPSLFPWVIPDSLTFASPHPALGNHLPLC